MISGMKWDKGENLIKILSNVNHALNEDQNKSAGASKTNQV